MRLDQENLALLSVGRLLESTRRQLSKRHPHLHQSPVSGFSFHGNEPTACARLSLPRKSPPLNRCPKVGENRSGFRLKKLECRHLPDFEWFLLRPFDLP